MTRRKEVGLPIPGHFWCNKNFQILIRSELHQLADGANENYAYIAYLFII